MYEAIDVDIRASGYENVYFDCPKCKKENILNRVNDLQEVMPISRREGIVCQTVKCKQKINLVSDTIVEATYRWFFDELYILIARKEYRAYVLNVCQGMESFFMQAIVNKEVDRNLLLREYNGSLDMNQYLLAAKKIETKIKKYTFKDLRKYFLKTFRAEKEAYLPITKLKLKEDKRIESFNIIKNTKIDILRNSIIHKYAYRPKYEELESLQDLIKAAYWLGMYLDVKDSITLINRRIEFLKT